MQESFFVSKYSDGLIAEVRAYYRAAQKIELSQQEACRYLDSLADLWRCFERSAGGAREEPPPPAAAPNPLPLLILDSGNT
jgi:hypothetical protein